MNLNSIAEQLKLSESAVSRALNALPTAVCCISDHVAIGAMRALRDCGLVPGREVSIIGCDGLEIGNRLEPPLSTMTQPLQSTGQQLVEIVINLVETVTAQKIIKNSTVQRWCGEALTTLPCRVGQNTCRNHDGI